MKLNLLLPSLPSISSVSMKFLAMAAASNLFLSMCDLFLIVCFVVVDGLFIYNVFGHGQFAAADPWLKATLPCIEVLVLLVVLHTS
jgi:hypothetical protein